MWKNSLIVVLASLLAVSWFESRSTVPPAPSLAPRPTAPLVLAELDPPVPSPYAALEQTMVAMHAEDGFSAASLGLVVFADEDEPVFNYRGDEAMTPASTLKAVTSATAMAMLGTGHRFTTTLAATTPWSLDAEGAYEGDLILVGGGDPMFASMALAQWVEELKAKGLKKVKGRVVTDARYFPEQMIPNAWDWGDVSNYYGAGPCGLNLDFNRFDVSFRPAKEVGMPGEIAEMSPPLPWLARVNFTATSETDSSGWLSVYGGPYASALTFRGQVPRDGGFISAEGAIPDPAFHGAERLKSLLELEGVPVVGEATTRRRLEIGNSVALPGAMDVLLTHDSAPLREIVRYLHRTSDNMVTECLFQELTKADPLSRPARALIKGHWEKQGVPFFGLRMEDGSGLARADDIRPVDLAKVLWAVQRSPIGEVFKETLNIYHNGRLRWKGGAMSRVRAYTGYSDNGYTFALMINHYEASADRLASWRLQIMETLLALPAVSER